MRGWTSPRRPVHRSNACLGSYMSRFLNRLLGFLRPVALRPQLKAMREQLDQARQRNVKTERQLERTRWQLEQARAKNKEIRQRLKQTRQQSKQGGAGSQSKRDSRENLLQKMPSGSVCAEIGVHEGKFSRRILDIVKPERLHLIDPWKHEEEDRYRESWYGGLGSDGQALLDRRYHEVEERFDKEIRTQRVQIHRSYSDVALENFEDSYFDWIYIDGNHLYEFVKKDLELYYPKIKPNGHITGDDYGVQNNWWENGVQKAVDEFVSRRPELTLKIDGTQFIITKGV